MIVCQNIAMEYGDGEMRELVLNDVSLAIAPGEACVLLGPSGSGKTTLLSILGCLLTPTRGDVVVGGERVNWLDRDSLADLRRQRMGFVFQQAHLLPFLTIQDNLLLMAENAGVPASEAHRRIHDLVGRLDIERSLAKYPRQLSGGQRQRAAVVRALIHAPAVVLADEPTASLDWHRGEEVADLLVATARALNVSLLMVTHDTRMISKFDRIFKMMDGRLHA